MFKKILAAVTAAIIFILAIAPERIRAADTDTFKKYNYNNSTSSSFSAVSDNVVYNLFQNPSIDVNDIFIVVPQSSKFFISFFAPSRFAHSKINDYHCYVNNLASGSAPYCHIVYNSTTNMFQYWSWSPRFGFPYAGEFSVDEFKSIDFSYLYDNYYTVTNRSMSFFYSESAPYNFGLYEDSQYTTSTTFALDNGCQGVFFYRYDTDTPEVVYPSFTDSPVSSPLNIDKDSFVEWIINKNKLPYIYEQSGIEIPASKLSLLVDFYDQQGSSLINFILLWPVWAVKYSFSVADAASQKNLFTALRTLYKQYLWYKNGSVSDDVYGPHLPDFIKPNTNKDDQTLITDTEEDTTDISLLREILRAVLNIPKYIQSSVDQIDTRLDELIYNINLLPDNVAGHAYAAFSSDIKTLISALDNVGGTTNIEIDIPEDKESEVELFFDEWSTKFDTKLDEKIPVASQLSDLFSSDFFEKCGIDVNEDGEVYQYYNAPVQLMNLPAASPGTEVSTAESGEKAAVRSMLLKFDDSDPEYLTDAAFTTDIPEWSVSIGGNKVEIFSFKLYAKYRPQIHALITFVLFVGYLFSLYKSIPKIIGNVSDVQNAFDSYDNSKRGDL